MSLSKMKTTELEDLQLRATEELPSYLEPESEAAIAWVARRVLELCEIGRKRSQTVQAILATWAYDNAIWMAHPDQPATFREFLKGVGATDERARLSPSVISDMSAIAEIIVPFADEIGLDPRVFFGDHMWTKFREAVPKLRAAAKEEDAHEFRRILGVVKELPNRDAVREELRAQRGNKDWSGDIITRNGRSIVVLALPTEQLHEAKRVLSTRTQWDVFVSGDIVDNHAKLEVVL